MGMYLFLDRVTLLLSLRVSSISAVCSDTFILNMTCYSEIPLRTNDGKMDDYHLPIYTIHQSNSNPLRDETGILVSFLSYEITLMLNTTSRFPEQRLKYIENKRNLF